MASHLQLSKLLALRHPYTTFRPYHRISSTSWCSCRKVHTLTNNTCSLPVLRLCVSDGIVGVRHIGNWNPNGDYRSSVRERIIVILSVGTFLLYFLWLREPNEIDEYMSRPIWERVPGISPEKAERMMEVDKSLGLQVDYAALEKYKQEYYAKELEKMETEKQFRRKHQELLQAVSSSKEGDEGPLTN